MEKGKISEAQKAAQKKYDAKTKTISIKYTPADMRDYEELADYLKQTGQSANGFIKKLVKEFLNITEIVVNPVVSEKEMEAGAYLKFGDFDEEKLEKLSKILKGNKEKYNIVLDCYAEMNADEIKEALIEKADGFGEWVDQFCEKVENGEIDVNVSKEEFEEIVEKSMDRGMKDYITCYC